MIDIEVKGIRKEIGAMMIEKGKENLIEKRRGTRGTLDKDTVIRMLMIRIGKEMAIL